MVPHDLEEFLREGRITEEVWQLSNIQWLDLMAIGQDLVQQRSRLETVAAATANVIQRFSGVHSVRWRIKDPSHLMAKIVRKLATNTSKYKNISVSNYTQIVDDLIGLRALHLYKSDSIRIDQEVRAEFAIKEGPVAYVREGDNPQLIKEYSERGMHIKVHPDNYRSIHYILLTGLGRTVLNAELQVRTIFEEGWSEIDHNVRYPNFPNSPQLQGMLDLLNGMAGQADSAGGLIQELAKGLQASTAENIGGAQQADDEPNLGIAQDSFAIGVKAEVVSLDGNLVAQDSPIDIAVSATLANDGSIVIDGPVEVDVMQDYGQQVSISGSAKSSKSESGSVLEVVALDKKASMTALENLAHAGKDGVAGRGAVLKALDDQIRHSVAAHVLEEQNAVLKTLNDLKRVGMAAQLVEEQNAAWKALDDQMRHSVAAHVLEEQNAVLKTLNDLKRVGVAANVLGEQNAVLKALDDQMRHSVAAHVLEEQNAVLKTLNDLKRVGMAAQLVEEQNALESAFKRLGPPD